MSIVINLDVIMAKRKVSSKTLAKAIGITEANLSILKTGKAKAIRLATLNKICQYLNCEVGDVLEFRSEYSESNSTGEASMFSASHEFS